MRRWNSEKNEKIILPYTGVLKKKKKKEKKKKKKGKEEMYIFSKSAR